MASLQNRLNPGSDTKNPVTACSLVNPVQTPFHTLVNTFKRLSTTSSCIYIYIYICNAEVLNPFNK